VVQPGQKLTTAGPVRQPALKTCEAGPTGTSITNEVDTWKTSGLARKTGMLNTSPGSVRTRGGITIEGGVPIVPVAPCITVAGDIGNGKTLGGISSPPRGAGTKTIGIGRPFPIWKRP